MSGRIFRETGQRVEDFTDVVLVKCPRCGKCARVIERDRPTAYTPSKLFSGRRLVCDYCGLAKDWENLTAGSVGMSDPYFQEPLWLQTLCCGHILWAYNLAHVHFIESFVGARLREAYPNGTLASRLPGWMKNAKNRDEVLKCIERLKEIATGE